MLPEPQGSELRRPWVQHCGGQPNLATFMCVHTHVCIHVCVHPCVCAYTHDWCVHVCAYVCTGAYEEELVASRRWIGWHLWCDRAAWCSCRRASASELHRGTLHRQHTVDLTQGLLLL